MDLPPIIPLFIASAVFGTLGAVQFALWATVVLSSRWGGAHGVMLASAVAYGAIGAVFFIGARRQRERNRRVQTHRCIACGYQLRGNLSGVCPECGRPVRESGKR